MIATTLKLQVSVDPLSLVALLALAGGKDAKSQGPREADCTGQEGRRGLASSCKPNDSCCSVALGTGACKRVF